jgi:hypothetical protein
MGHPVVLYVYNQAVRTIKQNYLLNELQKYGSHTFQPDSHYEITRLE